MAEMRENWICIRQCFHHMGADPRKMRTYYPGDKLGAGAAPNRHFAIDGVIPEDTEPFTLYGPGDDARPTNKLREDLIKKHGKWMEANGIVIKPDTSRKELFTYWSMAEEAIRVKVAIEKAKTEPFVDKKEPDALPAKKLTDMSPDEIDALSSNDVSKMIQRDFNKYMKPTAKNKDELVTRYIQMDVHGGK